MQYLKEEIKNKIMSAALEEFSRKGFTGSSMRNIAENAGVAIGNVYRYFPGKDELFNEIMHPVYEKIMYELENLKNQGTSYTVFVLESIVNNIMQLLKDYKIQIMILVDNCKGTRYAHTKEDIILFAENAIRDNLLPLLNKKGIEVKDNFIFYVMASTFIEGFIIILRKYDDEQQVQRLIRQLMILFFNNINERFV